MEPTKITTNHKDIKRWVEERGGHPARVRGTEVEGSSGVLLIDYPGYSGTHPLEAISWDEFFKGFEENELAFLYEDERKAGSRGRFSKLINRDLEEEKQSWVHKYPKNQHEQAWPVVLKHLDERMGSGH